MFFWRGTLEESFLPLQTGDFQTGPRLFPCKHVHTIHLYTCTHGWEGSETRHHLIMCASHFQRVYMRSRYSFTRIYHPAGTVSIGIYISCSFIMRFWVLWEPLFEFSSRCSLEHFCCSDWTRISWCVVLSLLTRVRKQVLVLSLTAIYIITFNVFYTFAVWAAYAFTCCHYK